MKADKRGTLRRVLTYIGKYKYYVFASFFLAAVTVVLTLLAPVYAGEAIDQITDLSLIHI